jgi:hypothetical protein
MLDVSQPGRFQAETHWPISSACAATIGALLSRQPLRSTGRSHAYDDIVSIEANHRQFSSDGNVIIGDVPAEPDATRAFVTSIRRSTRANAGPSHRLFPEHEWRVSGADESPIATLLEQLLRRDPFNWVERVANELTTQMIANRRLSRGSGTAWPIGRKSLTSPQAGALVHLGGTGGNIGTTATHARDVARPGTGVDASRHLSAGP